MGGGGISPSSRGPWRPGLVPVLVGAVALGGAAAQPVVELQLVGGQDDAHREMGREVLVAQIAAQGGNFGDQSVNRVRFCEPPANSASSSATLTDPTAKPPLPCRRGIG